jgi:hypothetical protein
MEKLINGTGYEYDGNVFVRGRFAVIFLAKYYNKREAINVAAKTLKGTGHKMRTQTKSIRSLGSTSTTGGSCD